MIKIKADIRCARRARFGFGAEVRAAGRAHSGRRLDFGQPLVFDRKFFIFAAGLEIFLD